ncbi:hypothetical protein JCM3774_000562 [Rhodotorula dairenensis]
MIRNYFSPERWRTYSAVPTSWHSAPTASPGAAAGRTSPPLEEYSALRHVKSQMSRSRKVVLALAVAGLVISAPFIFRLEARAPFGSPASHASWSVSSTKAGVRTEAADGTPRAGLFSPLAGSTDNEPSVSLRSFLDSHFGPPASSPYHVWVTMADSGWARSGTAAMHTFIEQLNAERRARYGKRSGGVKETRLVVLCLDEGCIEIVRRYKDARGQDAGGGYAYGGFLHNRPEKILPSTWPKLATFTEVLSHRDLFFVDADVNFRYDPYPHVEPFMNGSYDLVASENNAWNHINTGWMWLRRSQVTVDAWAEVLRRDLESVSRDQNRFNEVLDTEALRAWGEDHHPDEKPVQSDFVAANSLRVHVLDDNVFRAHHFAIDRPFAARDQSVFLHMTCGDDTPTKVYAAKSQGFWSDVESYYTAPPPMVTVDRLSGSQAVVTQMVKILLTVAHYTHRALLPPSHVTFLDLDVAAKLTPSHVTRPVHNAFALPHLAENLEVEILEPDYVRSAAAELMGRSVLGSAESAGITERARLRADVAFSPEELAQRREKVVQLGDVVEIDMRHTPTLVSFLRLLRSERFSTTRAPTIKLINFDQPPPSEQAWRTWSLPELLNRVEPCRQLEQLPGCDAICRGSLAQLGTILYHGPVPPAKGDWYGIEWDDPARGKHSGVYDKTGQRYFETRVEGAGSFLRTNAKGLDVVGQTFIEAVSHKYLGRELPTVPAYSEQTSIGSAPASDPAERSSVQRFATSSNFDVEVVLNDRVTDRFKQLGRLREIGLEWERVSSAGPSRDSSAAAAAEPELEEFGTQMKKLESLDMSYAMLPTLWEASMIASVLPRLTRLSLNANRFRRIEEPLVVPGFERLTTLQLNDTLMSWVEIRHVAPSLPNLVDLQFGHNRLRRLSATLTRLNLGANELDDWEDLIEELSNLPRLRELVLSDNHLASLALKPGQAIPDSKEPAEPPSLQQLEYLSLSGNRLESWASSFDELGRVASRVFPALRSLSVVGNPISTTKSAADGETTSDTPNRDALDAGIEGERLLPSRQEVHVRLLVIARLPFLNELEGTPVRQPERTDAERYWLGRFKDGTESATDLSAWAKARVTELHEHHPDLDPVSENSLAEASAAPHRTIRSRLLRLSILPPPELLADKTPATVPLVLAVLPTLRTMILRTQISRLLARPIPKTKYRLVASLSPAADTAERVQVEIPPAEESKEVSWWGLQDGDVVQVLPL